MSTRLVDTYPHTTNGTAIVADQLRVVRGVNGVAYTAESQFSRVWDVVLYGLRSTSPRIDPCCSTKYIYIIYYIYILVTELDGISMRSRLKKRFFL